MAVNRFDTPVESQYISQYVPIPFQELYTIGKEYNNRVDKAYDDLNSALSKWADFRSPSAIDTQRWYDLTLGGARNLINDLATHPDKIKTPEGRQMIQSYINNVDYSALSQLKQQRDNFLKRQALEQKLAAEGRFFPEWHNFDYTNYDTLGDATHRGMGLLTGSDLNLIPYQSIQEIVRPYTDQVEDSLISSDGMWDYYGKSSKRLREQVDYNRSEILSTPATQMHIRALMNRGLTAEQATNTVMNQIYTAAEERRNLKREANPYYLANLRSSGSRRTGNDADEEPPVVTTRTDEVVFDSREKLLQNLENMYKPILDKDGKDTGKYEIDSEVFRYLEPKIAEGSISTQQAMQASALWDGMKKVFQNQTEFRDDKNGIPDDVLSRVAKAIKEERGNTDSKEATLVRDTSKYFKLINDMYDNGMDEMMVDNTAYSIDDLNFLFGDNMQFRSLLGKNVLTPKQYILYQPGIRDFIESQGISTESVQADTPWWTSDENYDIEEIVAKDPANAIPVAVNKVTIIPSADGRKQIMYKVTVKYPVDKLPAVTGALATREGVIKHGGYSVSEITDPQTKESKKYLTTDVLVVSDYNDQMRRRFDMLGEDLAGSSDSKKKVRQTFSDDQYLIGRNHLIAGQH